MDGGDCGGNISGDAVHYVVASLIVTCIVVEQGRHKQHGEGLGSHAIGK